jgi:hypothetical protein
MLKIRETKKKKEYNQMKIHLASVNEFYAQLRILRVTIFQQNS